MNSTPLTPYDWQYLPLLLQILAAVFLGVAIVVSSWFVGRHRNTKVKLAAYECGIQAVGDAQGRFSVRFYMVAVIFILFDVEMVFMMPWAVIYRQLPHITGSRLLRLMGDACLPRLRRRRPLLHCAQRDLELESRQSGPLNLAITRMNSSKTEYTDDQPTTHPRRQASCP